MAEHSSALVVADAPSVAEAFATRLTRARSAQRRIRFSLKGRYVRLQLMRPDTVPFPDDSPDQGQERTDIEEDPDDPPPVDPDDGALRFPSMRHLPGSACGFSSRSSRPRTAL